MQASIGLRRAALGSRACRPPAPAPAPTLHRWLATDRLHDRFLLATLPRFKHEQSRFSPDIWVADQNSHGVSELVPYRAKRTRDSGPDRSAQTLLEVGDADELDRVVDEPR